MKKNENIIKSLKNIKEIISDKEKNIEKTREEINELKKLIQYLEVDLKNYHFENPHPGDFWHDCYSPVLIVLDVIDENLVICENTISNENDTYSFDLHKTKKIDKKEFNRILTYGSIPNNLMYNVIPLRCLKEVEIWKEKQNNLASFEKAK